ncbi:uncharacterized protein LOC130811122 isoform X1 [Amaranthus tricolor]|uniref:uncharacterized protein LOC130811122 isoform X1 n=2 Tax=Amaranthus tricolor TaxID=29722 RepID=UPI00258262C5|nr:uncharacterized protein LOC130811122 isoform X1 [Amaranthus tricolor]
MEPVASIVDKLNSFVKSGEDFFARRRQKMSRQNPIEIMKRLHREAFADLMKLRDRQDKVEKMLTYMSVKGSPFQKDGTLVRGEVDVTGALSLKDYLDQDNVDAMKRAGMRTGINAKIIFETIVREKNIIEAEFIANPSNNIDSSNIPGSALSLAKLSYRGNVTDWCSMVAIPMGAKCKDLSSAIDPSFEEKGLTGYSSFGPPLLHQDLGSAIGVMVKKSNVVASLGQFVVDLPGPFGHCFSTFGQIICQLPRSTKLSIFGLHQGIKPRQQASFGALATSLGFWRCLKCSEESTGTSLMLNTNLEGIVPAGSVAVMLESELDESTKIRGWLQMRNDSPKHSQWSVGMSDLPEDGVGWGLNLSGTNQHTKSWDHFQIETFLKFNLGNRFSVLPSFIYVMDCNHQIPALMLRSTWSI